MSRTNDFQHTVLALLWLIFLYVADKRLGNQLHAARDNCIRFGDMYGVEGENAKNIDVKIPIGGWIRNDLGRSTTVHS